MYLVISFLSPAFLVASSLCADVAHRKSDCDNVECRMYSIENGLYDGNPARGFA